MKLILVLSIIASFILGYGIKEITQKKVQKNQKVNSIGGIFFKSKNPKELRAWYQKNLGMNMDAYGTNFEWRQAGDSTQKGFTLWAPFKETTKYFEPSGKDFMINYRVADLQDLLTDLKKEGIEAIDKIDSASYGYFVHIMDIEGNKIELWQPQDNEYKKIITGITK